jgi:hypothetical protein
MVTCHSRTSQGAERLVLLRYMPKLQLWSPIHGSIYRVWVRSGGQRDEPVGGVGIFRTDGITMKQIQASIRDNLIEPFTIVLCDHAACCSVACVRCSGTVV